MSIIKCPVCSDDMLFREDIFNSQPIGQDGHVMQQCMCKGFGFVRVEYHEITQTDIDNNAELRAMMQLKKRSLQLFRKG